MANDYKYRADPIGQLVSPETIEGPPTPEQLDGWTKRALGVQSVVALPVATDGEYRRSHLAAALVERGRTGAAPTLVAEEAAFALASTKTPLKVSLPSASAVVKAVGGDPETTAAAAIKSLQAEAAALIAAGVAYVQFNASAYDDLLSEDLGAKLATYAAWDHALISGIDRPSSVRIGVRFGRSGAAPMWTAGSAVETMFALPADRLLIDFGLDPKDFSVLSLVPAKADVVLGLIDNQCKTRQSTDGLLSAIDAAAKIIDGTRLALSPRGGFSAKNGVTWAQQRNALEQLVEAATSWWGFSL